MEAIKNAYGLIERFTFVYLMGISVSLLAPLWGGFRMPSGYPQGLLALAGVLAAWAFARKKQRVPNLLEYLLAVLGCAIVLAGVKFYIASKFAATAQMEGPGLMPSMLFRTLWESMLLAVLYSGWFSRFLVPRAPPAPKAKPLRTSVQAAAPIPLTIGFASLGTASFETLREQDARTIGPLFAQALVPKPANVPSAQVLFLYGSLNEDGTIRGLDRPVGVRQVVAATKADIVVVASENGIQAIQAAIALPGPKTANLVFVLKRNGNHFAQFFGNLFRDMRLGMEMLSAWVKLCPQGPASDRPDMPATLLIAEGGKIAFPAPMGLNPGSTASTNPSPPVAPAAPSTK